jgi:exodeoxyribonuclease-3
VKLYSWNVNGFRAVLKKGFWDWFRACDADVVCLQETKLTLDQISEKDAHPEGYTGAWCESRVKKGYSGVVSFHRQEPLSVRSELDDETYGGEGRCVVLEYDAFYLFNIYYPNGQKDDERLAYKMGYYDAFLEQAEELRKEKPIVVCGDFNTAHKEIDLTHPKANAKKSGFLPEERAWIDKFIEHGYLDTFRLFEEGPEHYTWWSYRANARSKNVGWRLDYFFVSEELKDKVKAAWIEADIMGSDHCPVGLEIEV